MKKILLTGFIYALSLCPLVAAEDLEPESLPDTITEQAVEQKTYTQNYSDPEYKGLNFWKEMVNMVLTLGMILVFLFALTRIMHRMQTGRIRHNNVGGIIKIMDHRPLSTKTGLYLLQVHNRMILVADTQTGTTLLADFSADEVGVAEESESPPPFKL